MPNRFRFRLDRLLRLRELTEQVRLRKLGGAIAATALAERAREAAIGDERDAEKALSAETQEGPLDLESLKTAWQGLEMTRGGLRRSEKDLSVRIRDEGAAREAYAAAGRDRTVLSHLRQKKELEHMREHDRWEQKLLDEAGARRR